VNVVVAVNRFTTDTDAELATVVERAQSYGAMKGKACVCGARAHTLDMQRSSLNTMLRAVAAPSTWHKPL
jgi:formyltetrahydrofolate synthetase